MLPKYIPKGLWLAEGTFLFVCFVFFSMCCFFLLYFWHLFGFVFMCLVFCVFVGIFLIRVSRGSSIPFSCSSPFSFPLPFLIFVSILISVPVPFAFRSISFDLRPGAAMGYPGHEQLLKMLMFGQSCGCGG